MSLCRSCFQSIWAYLICHCQYCLRHSRQTVSFLFPAPWLLQIWKTNFTVLFFFVKTPLFKGTNASFFQIYFEINNFRCLSFYIKITFAGSKVKFNSPEFFRQNTPGNKCVVLLYQIHFHYLLLCWKHEIRGFPSVRHIIEMSCCCFGRAQWSFLFDIIQKLWGLFDF